MLGALHPAARLTAVKSRELLVPDSARPQTGMLMTRKMLGVWVACLHPLVVPGVVQETACLSNNDGELPAVALPLAVALVLQPCRQASKQSRVHAGSDSLTSSGTKTSLAKAKQGSRQQLLTLQSNSRWSLACAIVHGPCRASVQRRTSRYPKAIAHCCHKVSPRKLFLVTDGARGDMAGTTG